MEKIWYAVQTGNNYEWDNGSFDLDEAKALAEKECENNEIAGDEVRIVVIDQSGNEPMATNEIIIREGNRI